MSKTILAQTEHSVTGDTKMIVSHGVWRKREYIDVRTHWQAPSGEWFPTKRGVRLTEDMARAIHSDLAKMLGLNGNGHKPKRNGHKPSYAPIRVNDSTFPNRKTWPRNKEGGFKVSLYGMPRVRHDGVRCYGDHHGKTCIPYDFSREPTIPQATFIAQCCRDIRQEEAAS